MTSLFGIENVVTSILHDCFLMSRVLLARQSCKNAVVTNGRILKAQDVNSPSSRLIAADFLLLENFAVKSQLGASVRALCQPI